MTPAMTPRLPRNILFAVFIGGLALQCATLYVSRAAIWPEELSGSLLTLLKIYSVPLAVILGGTFARPRGGAGGASATVCWAAIILSVCWNVLLAARTTAFGLARENSISDLIKYLESISAGASFLIAGMLAFCFGKSAK